MNESESTEHKNPSQELLKRISSKKRTKTRKKIPKFFIFLNIFILIVVIFHQYRTIPERHVNTTILRYNDTVYRLSITQDEEKKTMLLVLTAKNESDRTMTTAFEGKISQVTIKHIDTDLETVIFGKGTGNLELKTKGAKSFILQLDDKNIKKFADEHREYLAPFRRTLLSMENRHIPLTAEFSLCVKNKIATELNFKYYIK